MRRRSSISALLLSIHSSFNTFRSFSTISSYGNIVGRSLISSLRSTSSSSKSKSCYSITQSRFKMSATASAPSSLSDSNNLILVVGSSNQDLTSTSDILPTLGETVMGKTFTTTCGGKGANQAVAAASLNMAPVAIVTRVGDDTFGTNLLDNFRRVGVDYFGGKEETVLKAIPSGVASIVVDEKSGDNMIVVSPGANYELTPECVRRAVIAKRPSQILVQLEILPQTAFMALKSGKEVGSTTILNTAPAPEDFSLEDDPNMEFFQYVDILISNESELKKIAGGSSSNNNDNDSNDEEALAKSLLEKGVRIAVIVTLGARGAMIVENKGSNNIQTTIVDAPENLPARKLPVKNTVGAGDSFCGALAAYRATGLSLVNAAKYACGVASMTVRKDGAQASYPLYDELPACLKVNEKLISNNKRLKTSANPRITFVTGNKKKLEEVKQILRKDGSMIPYEITNQKIDLPELQGDAIEIAKEKCILAAKKVKGAVFIEDTSLCFNALNGMPGPYIKWFLDSCGHVGLNKMLDGFEDRSAYAQTIIAYTTGPDDEVFVFDGRTDGNIVTARGPLDFGWDPVFAPTEGEGKTYAEMNKEFKNTISHRGRAFEKFRAFLIEKK